LRAYLRVFFSGHYWRNQFSPSVFLKSFFAVVGVIGAALEASKQLISLFRPDGNWLQLWLQHNYWTAIILVAVLALLVAISTLAPTVRVSSRLKQRDLTVAIELGDLFDGSEVLVIGTNRTFDTELKDELISPRSIQGQFTKRYYNSVQHLDAELDAQLRDEPHVVLTQNEKRVGKLRQFEMGTVAKVNVATRTTYLVAMATMNAHGVANCSIDDLRASLVGLWQHIADKGGGLPRLRVPVLGTGFGKLKAPRQAVVKEILRSIVAASAADRLCESFTIVVSVKDYLEHEIDLTELGEYLRYLTTYTELRSAAEVGHGVAIG
jgi:hypothetical protein